MAMRILVTGGTGCPGREVVPQCLQRGWTVRVMSRKPRTASIRLPVPGKAGRAFMAGRAVPTAGELGSRTWRSWLADRYQQRTAD